MSSVLGYQDGVRVREPKAGITVSVDYDHAAAVVSSGINSSPSLRAETIQAIQTYAGGSLKRPSPPVGSRTFILRWDGR